MRLTKAQSTQFDDHAKLLPGECIRLLRDRIESSGTAVGVSDGTISAVAALAGIEVIRLFSLSFREFELINQHEKGNLKMMRMHLDGLKRMLHIRGGLSSVRDSNPMVANSVFWSVLSFCLLVSGL
jgi:hypothetical protein